MRFTSKTVARAAAFGVAAAAIAVPLSSLGTAQAVTNPSLSTTSTVISVADGGTISVTGANFAPSVPVYVAECATGGGCNETPGVANGDVQIGMTDATGAFTEAFKVAQGTIGTGVCGKATPTSAVPSDTQCYIAASTAITGQTAANSATLPFWFNPVLTLSHSTSLTGGQKVAVSGAGFPGGAAQTVYVIECSGPSQDQCGVGTLVNPQPKTTAAGTFTGATLTIVNGSLGSNLNGKSAGSCTSSSKTCIIAATDSLSGGLAFEGQAPITLAAVPQLKTSVTAKASAKKVPSTKKFTISGTVKAGGKAATGIKATLYSVTGKKLHKLASMKVTKGKFKSAKLKGPKKSAKYEVKILKQTVKGSIYLASASKVITVKK